MSGYQTKIVDLTGNGDLGIHVPNDILESLDLKTGDRVKWTINEDSVSFAYWDGQLDLFENVEDYVSVIE